MNNIILFDDDNWQGLLPLTFTRPIAELRVGILTIAEKWKHRLDGTVSYITQDYLSEKFPINITDDNLIINAAVLPNEKLLQIIKQLQHHEAILDGEDLIAARLNGEQFDQLINDQPIPEMKGIDIADHADLYKKITRPHHLFSYNDEELKLDFNLLTKGRKSAAISDTNSLINQNDIFLEEGASVEYSILNATDGPIYIGKNAQVMEGSIIKGSFSMLDHSVIKMGAKIYGKTSLGPHCKVGGEVGNSILIGYSSKAHDGYLGNSVLGEWCNLGAGTNNSNLKNNYAEVKLWSYPEEKFAKTGLQFCGLIMGDHSKCAISTTFNTGTVVGVFTNIYGSGFPRNYVPSYSWGGAAGFKTYKVDKAYEVAEKVMGRRSLELGDLDKKILKHIFLSTSSFRSWEK